MGGCHAVAVALAALLLARTGHSLRFYLANGERRCFTFEASANTLIHGTALADAGAGAPELDVSVRPGPGGGGPPVFSGRLRSSSKFSFRTPAVQGHLDHDGDEYDAFEDEDGDDEAGAAAKAAYAACVTLVHGRDSGHDGAKRAVTFHVRPASQRGSAEDAAAEGSVKGVSLAMRQMHETLGQLTKDIALLQKRERKLLKRNKRVSARVVSLAVFAIFVLCCTAALQVVYFMNFFKQKKLL